MAGSEVTPAGKLCSLCRAFTTDLVAFDFKSQPSYQNDRWHPIGEYSVTGYFPERSWGDGFRHHESLADLEASAASCGVCLVLHRDLSVLDETLCHGWLGLYPWWEGMRLGPNMKRGLFRAGFRDGLVKMPWGSSTIASTPLHTFKLCRRPGVVDGCDPKLQEAQPPTPDPTYIASRIGKWTRQCINEHPDCVQGAARRGRHPLPTRVLDLGEVGSDELVRLYQSQGKLDDYVALSHCWGGRIPSITVKDNVEARASGIDVADLPKNFRDAIQVTRALGVRYLWIDALCIIQDSAEDWFAEAGKMASVYAGAKIVISLLDAGSSTVGFLGDERIPLGIVDERYAVQKVGRQLYEYLEQCPLTTRGWCMQERLLAPSLLHVGRERMFWECLKKFTCEDGREEYGDSTGHVMGLFISLRTRMARSEEHDWKDWYTLVEEYTTRQFTFARDKLPAIAGAAALFQSKRDPTTYVAGLWREDIGRGLLWGAHYFHVPGRKVWGYSRGDKCNALCEPEGLDAGRQRAPSWSWASLDGQIDHWGLRIGPGTDWYEIVDVTMDEADAGQDPLTRPYVSGRVRVRGPMEKMRYNVPTKPDPDVGYLTYADSEEVDEEKQASFGGCILDIDRKTARLCWALIATRSNSDRYMLILEERADGTFKRIGLCTAYGANLGPGRFAQREVVIT